MFYCPKNTIIVIIKIIINSSNKKLFSVTNISKCSYWPGKVFLTMAQTVVCAPRTQSCLLPFSNKISRFFAKHLAARVGTTSLLGFLPVGWNCHECDPVSTRWRGQCPGDGELHCREHRVPAGLPGAVIPPTPQSWATDVWTGFWGRKLFSCCILESLIQQLSLYLKKYNAT